jgi:hypothetical protein
MDASTITEQAITVSSNSGIVDGTVTTTGEVVVFKPKQNQLLAQGVQYSVTISADVKNIYGIAMGTPFMFFFDTETLPSIASHDPGRDTQDVPLNTDIIIRFSEPVSEPTISFTLHSIDPFTSAITGTVPCDRKSFDDTTAIFKPRVILPAEFGLAGNTTYTAKVSAGVQDFQGKVMEDDYVWSFTTGTAPDTTPPIVWTTTPTIGAPNVGVLDGISVTFREPVTNQNKTLTLASTTSGTVSIVCQHVSDALVSYNSTTVTRSFFQPIYPPPSQNLAYGTQYTATLSKNNVFDQSGNQMLNDYSWTFTTQYAGSTISVLSSSPTSTYGSPVTFLATVSPATATGTVTFRDGTTILGAGALSGGTVTYTTSSLALGSHAITATYNGDTNFAPATATLTPPQQVNKAVLTVTADNKSKIYGAANPTLTASYAGFVLGDTTAVLSGTSPSLSTSATTTSPVGTYPIAVTQGTLAAANYNFSFVNGTLTVTGGASQTITFGALSAKTYGDAPFTLAATASSGLPVTYSSSNTSVATISGSTVTIVGGGPTMITANQLGDATYSAAPPVSQNLTVNKADQTISNLASSLTKTFGDPDFAPGATASSSLPVSYASSNTSVATIVGGNIHIVGAGPATVTASQGGDSNYNAAPNVTQTLTVNKANQTITFVALPVKTFGNADFAPGATASSGLPVSYTSSNTSVATIVSNQVHIVGAGSTDIIASQAGNANYTAAPNVTQTLTVNPANQNITFGVVPAKTFGNADFALGATARSGLPVSYTSSNTFVATIMSNQVHIVGAGSTTITASQAGNANYNAAPDELQTLMVNKAATTTEITDAPDVTLGADGSVTVTVTSWLQQATGNVTLTVSGVGTFLGSVTGTGIATFTIPSPGLGSHVLHAQYGGDSNFLGSDTYGTLNVGVASTMTVITQPTPVTYGSNGSVMVTVSSGAGTPTGSVTLIVDSGMPSQVTLAQGLVNGSTTFTIVNPSAGTHTLNASYAQQGNFGASSASGVNLTVTARPLTITAAAKTKVYGASDPALTWQITSGSLVGSDTITGALTRVAGETVSGSPYAIQQGTLTAGSNYQITYIGANLTITTRPITITAEAKTKVYSASDPALTWQITSGSLVGSDTLTGVLTRDAGEAVGTYAIRQGTLANSNYQITFIGANLTIAKATPTITWANPADIAYGTPLSSTQLNATASVPGSFTYNPPADTILSFGTQTLSVTFTPTDTTNYNNASKSVQINVGKATPTITWANPADITYWTSLSGTQLNATASVPGSFAYTPAAGTILSAGVGQTLSVTFTPNDTTNYNNASKSVVIAVNKATASVTPNAASKTYNTSDPALSGTLSGFRPADNVTATYSRTAGETVAGSPYTISATLSPAGVLGNYNVTYNTANFTINKADQTITFGPLGNSVVGDPPFTLGATASSGLPVSYTSSDPNVATVSGSTVTIVGAGTTTITASQSGDANYNSALDVQQALTVNPGP